MNAVTKVEPRELSQADNVSPMFAMIERAARDPNVDMDKLERLMAMKERMDAQVAETAFSVAMSNAQSLMGRIAADRENKQTHSWYATYAALDRKVRPIYTECGFSLSFDTGQDAPAEVVRVLCYVSHNEGFTRTYHVDMPADGKGAKGGDVMTKTHAAGSAMQYGQRYLLKLIFNLAVGEDDDGNGASAGRELDDAALDWIDVANSLTTIDEYKDQQAKVTKSYGNISRIPKDVIGAFKRNFSRLNGASK